MYKKESGFTLVEIIMVLVLIGILSAVAVPKYFDLRDSAELQAMKAVGAEYQAQLNGKFAESLLADKSCADSRTDALTEANKLTASGYTVTALAATLKGGTQDLTIAATSGKSTTVKVAVPACSGDANP